MDPLCYLCFVFVFAMLSCLFLAGWEKADLLAFLCVKFSYFFVTSPYVVLGQVWYLIVSIPDIVFFLTLMYSDLFKDSVSYSKSRHLYSIYAELNSGPYQLDGFVSNLRVVG